MGMGRKKNQEKQREQDLWVASSESASGGASITPGTYFRMLLLDHFEGFDSERGIAWRTADLLSFREFLGYDPEQRDFRHGRWGFCLLMIENHRSGLS